MKLQLIDLLIYILLFIFVVSLPVELLNIGLSFELLIKIGLRLALLAFFIYVILKNKIKIFGQSTFKELLIFLPFFIICFSNIFASLIGGGFNFVKSSGLNLFLGIVLCLVSAVLEEIVFRLFIQTSLVDRSPLSRIILSALIFGLCHLINVVNVRSANASLDVLIQTVYTFGLGLVLGFIYEYGHSLLFVVVLHFAFNIFNDVLYGFLGGYTSTLVFILTGVVIALLAGAYGVVLYIKKYKNIEGSVQQWNLCMTIAQEN